MSSTSEIQDGGRQTGSTIISVPVQAIHIIPKVIPRFSTMADRLNILPTLSDKIRHRKSKMATAKPEVLLSQCLDVKAKHAILKVISFFSTMANSSRLLPTLAADI